MRYFCDGRVCVQTHVPGDYLKSEVSELPVKIAKLFFNIQCDSEELKKSQCKWESITMTCHDITNCFLGPTILTDFYIGLWSQ